MPAFPKPSFTHPFDVDSERAALRHYRDTEPGRAIPKRQKGRLLLASWNIANLGAQSREAKHYRLLAEVISWFDLVALQEVKDDRSGLNALMDALGGSWNTVFTDKAGNDERMAYVYRHSKVTPLQLCGELAIPPSELDDIKLPGVTRKFTGFDRNPFIHAFAAEDFQFCLVNVHAYFGPQNTSAQKTASMERRQLEAFAVGRWCDLRRRSKHRYTDHYVALGDFNLPKWEKNDPIKKALTARGLKHPEHGTRIASAIASDSDYDQILCTPGLTDRMLNTGVFDYDGGIFVPLWNQKTQAQFNAYLRYYMSDHRPIWTEVRL
jgi:endonuclease/exonuclease/phosphatase family metal-dependent hydrolase